ncbi:MAG: type III-B CRISPR module RAMP protein Cmr1, partial [Candidatus Eremiobacteraeota bacterium]|nr:type III-B CRISPR module RAMP protein Cmr1 [Candidatus Eremiobacteraeota bacterium]
MRKFTVKIEPLTPVWTGDANRKNTFLRETGIIGSLRWWYEALIRGLGGTACDPTNTKCDGTDHCDACELFGCTGWARKFRLEVESGTRIPEIQIGTRKKHSTRKGDKYLERTIGGFMA